MRCPKCGYKLNEGVVEKFVDYVPYGSTSVPMATYEGYDWECGNCGWCGDEAVNSYTEEYGIDPFRKELADVVDFLVVGTVEALENAKKELEGVINNVKRSSE